MAVTAKPTMLMALTFIFVMFNSESIELGQSKESGRQLFAGSTDAKPAILFPPVVTAQSVEQVLRKAIIIVDIYFFNIVYS